MSFWNISNSNNQLAVIDSISKNNFTYKDIFQLVNQFENKLNCFHKKTLGVILCRNNLDSLVVYLASLRTQHAVFILDAGLHPSLCTSIINYLSTRLGVCTF